MYKSIKSLTTIFLLFFTSYSQANWDFDNAQRWIGDSAEGTIEYCSEKSYRWSVPFIGFDVNKDDTDDFMIAVSCYQGEANSEDKHNLKVRAAWKMYCSNEASHYDCTQELFGSAAIETTAVPSDIGLGRDGGGNPYVHVTEKPRDLNGDGYPEFWYAVNRDDSRQGFDTEDPADQLLLETYCGPESENQQWNWDCTRKSVQTMLVSQADGSYDIAVMPWEPINTQAVLILPNTINTFDVWAMNYGPHNVARYQDGAFVDVTSEFEQDPNWDTVAYGGGPYAKAFELDGHFYVARADIPEDYRSEWASDVSNSGFMLWKYQAGSGFTLSDIYTPDQSETFTYQIEQGDTIEQRYGAMVGTTPVFDPRWHFFDLEVLDDSGEPVLMVQSEAFTQLGNSYRSMPDPDIVYSVGSRFAAQDSINTIWGGGSAIQGFFIRDGLLVERQLPVVEDDAIIDVAHKRFIDLNGDGFLDITAVSGAELPSIFINDGQGTLEKVFLGDLFPDLFGDASFWQVDNWNTHGWGALFYPFYAADKLDLLYWSKGFTFNIPPWIGENYVFSPGDIVVATNNSTANLLSKKLSSEEFSVLSEVCIANGWWGKHGYQIPCRLGTPFPNDEELDTDGDGVFDNLDAFRLNSAESIDTDSDGIGNNADTDDDNDGVSDQQDNCSLVENPQQLDTDSDGSGNACDTDDDNDGVVDANDAFPLDASESLDTDSDGIGNNADTDDDNDGVIDADDAFPLISLNGRTDTDGDGRPDECDAACLETGMIADYDDDGDGVNDDEDAFPLDASETMDSDSDGIGDNADAFPFDERYTADSDSDGMPDQWELYFNLDPSDPSDANSDYDFDGVSALDEFLAGTIPSLSLDIDGNRQYDALTDGLLLLRSMFGLEGDSLISGTVAADAIYDDATDIQQRIELLGESADIDADGNVDALTDGLLILRYLFGLRGDTLIDSVVSAQANRTSAEDIEDHLSQLTLQP